MLHHRQPDPPYSCNNKYAGVGLTALVRLSVAQTCGLIAAIKTRVWLDPLGQYFNYRLGSSYLLIRDKLHSPYLRLIDLISINSVNRAWHRNPIVKERRRQRKSASQASVMKYYRHRSIKIATPIYYLITYGLSHYEDDKGWRCCCCFPLITVSLFLLGFVINNRICKPNSKRYFSSIQSQ